MTVPLESKFVADKAEALISLMSKFNQVVFEKEESICSLKKDLEKQISETELLT